MRLAKRNIIVNLLILSISILVAFFLAEAILRAFPNLLSEEVRLGLHWKALDEQALKTVTHPYIGYSAPAHDEIKVSGRDVNFTYKTDGSGFRNSWPWPDVADIVVVGDSLAFGYGVDDPFTWVSLLAKSLPNIKIVNLGLSGTGPLQYLRIYETFGLPLKPKLLFFCLFLGNDLYDTQKFSEWLNKGGMGNYLIWRSIGNLKKKFLEWSYVYLLFRDAIKKIIRVQQGSGKTITLEDGNQIQLVPGILADAADRASPDDPLFQSVIDTIERTRRLAKKHGTELLVIFFPSKEEVYLPVIGEPCPNPIKPFRLELQKRDILYIDLTPAFHLRAKSGEKLFFEVDGHPNKSGYALIAETILNHLNSKSEEYGFSKIPK